MADVKIWFFNTGYCTAIERIVLESGKLQIVKFPATCALIQHPIEGFILFDTGYGKYINEETRCLPYRLYRWLTPMFFREEESAANHCKTLGVYPHDIKAIILSHFHADHIGGLKDFKSAKFIYNQAAYEHLKGLAGIKALMNGYLPGLLPKDFEKRSVFMNSNTMNIAGLPYEEFSQGYDILGDGSLVGVELPGHAKGQIGLLAKTQDRGAVFLVADACWHSRSYQKLEEPHWIARFILNNYKEYKTTVEKLHRFHRNHPKISIIPTHCSEIFPPKNRLYTQVNSKLCIIFDSWYKRR